MNQTKKSFLLYTDSLRVLDLLSNEKAGILFKAIKAKVNGDAMPEMDEATAIAFCQIEANLDRDLKRYEEICEKRREAGRQGGRPKSTEKQVKANALPEKQTKARGTKAKQKNPDNDNDNDNDINYIGEKRKRFIPPTIDQVRAYCEERKNDVDPEKFINFYTSKGWMIGKNKMKDWQAAVRNWERLNKQLHEKIQSKNKFNQFEHNTYDFDQLEKEIVINA